MKAINELISILTLQDKVLVSSKVIAYKTIRDLLNIGDNSIANPTLLIKHGLQCQSVTVKDICLDIANDIIKEE